MSVQNLFTEIITNLGVGIGDWLLILVAMAGVPLYAQDFRFGLLIHFIAFAYLFVFMDALNMPTAKVLILIFIILVLMSLGLLISFAKQGGGPV